MYDEKFKYSVGQKVVPDTFDPNIEKVCSSGIHFFLDKECAELFELYEKNFNGEYKSWHENGQLSKHCFFKDDKLDGEYKEWYENEQLSKHCFYINNKLDGEYKKWHENRQLYILGFYNDDKLDGEYKQWFSNGQIKYHCIYKDGNFIDSNRLIM
jgi:antitoxin component YwqK of YwqJK toxin-antitoxin module